MKSSLYRRWIDWLQLPAMNWIPLTYNYEGTNTLNTPMFLFLTTILQPVQQIHHLSLRSIDKKNASFPKSLHSTFTKKACLPLLIWRCLLKKPLSWVMERNWRHKLGARGSRASHFTLERHLKWEKEKQGKLLKKNDGGRKNDGNNGENEHHFRNTLAATALRISTALRHSHEIHSLPRNTIPNPYLVLTIVKNNSQPSPTSTDSNSAKRKKKEKKE